ncbi:ABC transporter permease [Paenibacillus riograndensis]|uniref:Binding-protein-dependent transport system inner membrane protein n=3 Tax=Paenibacillus riograndensis TaxID=483937 RepID=A0A0E4CXF5_9BACL|nr:ABC transporter permease [Paenibacillus riograndensis]CQR56307.1 binding-protein-dependent transport system inner membrane protein [Paenibacillus riograndensis SBR5]
MSIADRNLALGSRIRTRSTATFPDWLRAVLPTLSFGAALAVSVVIPTRQEVDLLPYRIVLLAFIGYFALRISFSRLSSKRWQKVLYGAPFYSVLGVALAVWDLLTTKLDWLPLPFVPGLAQIIRVMTEDANTLLISTAYSLRLLVIGFLIGSFIGIVLGVLIGWYRKWSYWMFPVLKVMGVVPATALIPIAMIVVPSSFYAGVLLIVIAVCFPVAFMTSVGIANVQNTYFEAARTLGADERFLIFRVAIPGAMPSIFSGIYTATGISFATLVVSEMIGAKAGLGWYINWAKGWSNYAKVYVSIIIMAVTFSMVMAVIFRVRDRVLKWQKGLVK